MTRGRFIALEGGEGTGKSTQARLLADALAALGHSVTVTREPGGTEGAEAIRALLLAPPGRGWGPRAEALLFAAARSDHVEKLIRPALDAGQWVVCDRFLDSSRAYQGGAGGLGDDTIMVLHDIGSGGLLPDMTVLIDVAPDTVTMRLAARDKGVADAIGGRGGEYHANVAHAFRRFAAAAPGRFVTVDGEGTPEEVHHRILAALALLPDNAA
ncbi:dTMP kinase [Allopontixanthobacter sediminis]|uniref:Thymidylate kinase n=1 Tax=Allopontixanthobacter sediminis TaxID=1689985 RepID=A0A845AZE5_9SPHN|nr:dTMP kinase [Allopontixanthobacter sediminis]MXP43600.1 dTMP kinase [Allopontixanthobacter sediminis]